MKVDWDKIIKENHTPSRASRRHAKMVGGMMNPLDMPLVQAFFLVTGLDVVVPPRESPPPRSFWDGPPSYQDYLFPRDDSVYNAWQEERRLAIERGEDPSTIESPWAIQFAQKGIPYETDKRYNPWGDKYVYSRAFIRQRMFEQTRARAENWVRTSEIPKELKEQEEEYRLGRENEARALLLRNEQNRKAQAARLLARNQATTAQSAARVQAAQQGATNVQGYLDKIQAVAAASAATKAQNLQSLQALATQKAAAAASEAEQQRVIQANSAQVLAEQNAEVARLRAEAMAKQAQLAKAPVATAPVGRRGKAPQVKFGGLRYY